MRCLSDAFTSNGKGSLEHFVDLHLNMTHCLHLKMHQLPNDIELIPLEKLMIRTG
jgi:hypothetical protein